MYLFCFLLYSYLSIPWWYTFSLCNNLFFSPRLFWLIVAYQGTRILGGRTLPCVLCNPLPLIQPFPRFFFGCWWASVPSVFRYIGPCFSCLFLPSFREWNVVDGKSCSDFEKERPTLAKTTTMATSRLSSYVSRIRRLQTLKTDDAFCLLEMRHSGLFLLFSDHDKPLLTKSKTSKLYTLPEITYGELSEEYFSHELHPEGEWAAFW